MATYSTPEAARKCGVHHITLQRWVSQGRIAPPRKVRVGGVVVRLWKEADLQKIRRYKQENYRKGRGRKPKPKR